MNIQDRAQKRFNSSGRGEERWREGSASIHLCRTAGTGSSAISQLVGVRLPTPAVDDSPRGEGEAIVNTRTKRSELWKSSFGVNEPLPPSAYGTRSVSLPVGSCRLASTSVNCLRHAGFQSGKENNHAGLKTIVNVQMNEKFFFFMYFQWLKYTSYDICKSIIWGTKYYYQCSFFLSLSNSNNHRA